MAVFETFGEWLETARRSERYSLRALAAELKVSHTHLSNLEKDPSKPSDISPRPDKDFVRRTARILRANAEEGLRLAGYPDPDDSDVTHEITYAPFLDEIREAGVIEDLPPETQQEILEYMRFRAAQERAKREGEK